MTTNTTAADVAKDIMAKIDGYRAELSDEQLASVRATVAEAVDGV